MPETTLSPTSPAAGVPRMDGVRVAVTHAREQAAHQSELFEALGAQVFHYPCIEIVEFEQNDEFDEALRAAAAGKYDWLVLNDADTVLVLADRIKRLGIDPRSLSKLKVATISCMTEQYTQELLGIQPAFSPEVYTPEIVAEAMRLELGERVLLPQSATTRAGLARHLVGTGADVDAVNAYRTIIGYGGDTVPVMLWEGKIDVVTFAFPTAVRYFAKRLKHEGGTLAMLDDVIVACIGPITGATAEEYGLKVAVIPQDHTISGLVNAVAEYVARK